MQCVEREVKRQRKRIASTQPGIGVTTSAGVYRRDTGKMLVPFEAESSDGDRRRTPRPLLVVASGKTTITLLGLWATSFESSTVCSGAGDMLKQEAKAPSRDSGRTDLDPA